MWEVRHQRDKTKRMKSGKRKGKDFKRFRRHVETRFTLMDPYFFLVHQKKGVGRFRKSVGLPPTHKERENAYLQLFNYKPSNGEEE